MTDPSFACLALGDPYKNPEKPAIRKFKRDTYKDGGHEIDWTPAKTLTHAKRNGGGAYEWMTPGVPKKKDMRNPENKTEVLIAPNNILNNPMKVGKVARRGDKPED